MSRRRRSNPVSSTKSAVTPKTSSLSSATPHNAVVDSQHEGHRLATIDSDSGGSVGSALTLFEQAAGKVARRPPIVEPLSPDDLRAEATRVRQSVTEAFALAEAASALRYAEWDAAVLRRRLQRTVKAEKRRLERDRRREEGGLYSNQPRSEGLPTRLAVDLDAWNFLKGKAIRGRIPVGLLVARLVDDAVSHSALPRVARDDRCDTQRFVRLIGLDVETWTTFKATALDAHVTATRMLGVVVEAEARRKGWRAPRPDTAF